MKFNGGFRREKAINVDEWAEERENFLRAENLNGFRNDFPLFFFVFIGHSCAKLLPSRAIFF